MSRGGATVDAAYVEAAARALGLELGLARSAAVLGNLERIAELARPVLEAELTPEDEAAPVWRP